MGEKIKTKEKERIKNDRVAVDYDPFRTQRETKGKPGPESVRAASETQKMRGKERKAQNDARTVVLTYWMWCIERTWGKGTR